MKIKPKGITIAKAYPNECKDFEYLLLNPTDCIEELKPCHKCNANNKNDILYKAVRTGLSNFTTSS